MNIHIQKCTCNRENCYRYVAQYEEVIHYGHALLDEIQDKETFEKGIVEKYNKMKSKC